MKNKTLPLCLSLFLSIAATAAWAQEAPAVEEKVLPTEISVPPYQVGNLVTERGYYIDRGEDLTQINFRIVDNQMRIYWIDADGLIAEPEAKVASVRFVTPVTFRPYHQLTALQGEAGLGAPMIIPAPHAFNLILNLENPENSKDLTTYPFRFDPSMDISVDPEIPTPVAPKAKK